MLAVGQTVKPRDEPPLAESTFNFSQELIRYFCTILLTNSRRKCHELVPPSPINFRHPPNTTCIILPDCLIPFIVSKYIVNYLKVIEIELMYGQSFLL